MLFKIQGKSYAVWLEFINLSGYLRKKEINSFSCIVLSQGQQLVKDFHKDISKGQSFS